MQDLHDQDCKHNQRTQYHQKMNEVIQFLTNYTSQCLQYPCFTDPIHVIIALLDAELSLFGFSNWCHGQYYFPFEAYFLFIHAQRLVLLQQRAVLARVVTYILSQDCDTSGIIISSSIVQDVAAIVLDAVFVWDDIVPFAATVLVIFVVLVLVVILMYLFFLTNLHKFL